MPTKRPQTAAPQIGNEAVQSGTGKSWPQWFRILDRAGCAAMNHKQIVAVLSARHPQLGGWWTQMVTVAYEQARGLREKHQRPDGYQISASRTIQAPLASVFHAFHDARSRRRWLPDDVDIRKATPGKSLRIAWLADDSRVDVNLYAKGEDKSQVSLQHGKLKNATQAQTRKTMWRSRLDVLKGILESS